MKNLFFLSLTLLILSGCETGKEKSNANETRKLAKFEPADGKCLYFVGQDLDALGGLENYKDGYLDHFEVPAGLTAYTNFRPGDKSFGHTYRGLDGLTTTDNWGAGDCNMQLMMDNPKLKHCALAIGLELVNHEGATARGERDSMIVALGNWIKNLGERPVFLRVGYEFDGHAWNHYNREEYLSAFKRIHNKLDSLKVSNVAYVWQSCGMMSNQEQLASWYPGDEYVDWCAYSYFSHPDKEMITFARKQKKPIFIAELTPVFQDIKTQAYQDTDIKKPEIAKQIWDIWFAEFFKTMDENQDLIKAFAYINANWPSEAMWIDNPTFQQVDSRIQMSEYVSNRWKLEISKDRYLKPNNDLLNSLSE